MTGQEKETAFLLRTTQKEGEIMGMPTGDLFISNFPDNGA